MSSAVWSLSGLYLIVSYYKPFEFPTLSEIIFLKELSIQSKKFTFSSYLRSKMFVYIFHHKPKSVIKKFTNNFEDMKKRWDFCSVWWDTLVLWTLNSKMKYINKYKYINWLAACTVKYLCKNFNKSIQNETKRSTSIK